MQFNAQGPNINSRGRNLRLAGRKNGTARLKVVLVISPSIRGLVTHGGSCSSHSRGKNRVKMPPRVAREVEIRFAFPTLLCKLTLLLGN